MKRKIAQIGPSTLMISLPSKWAKKFDLKKGHEIDILEHNEKLIVSTQNETFKKELEINVSSLDIMLYRLIGALYKSGYDQVKIIFNNPKQLETIYDVLRNTCLGFEIIEQSKNFIIIKEISKIEHSEFENVLRRNFLFLLSVSLDSFEAAKKQDYDELKNITLRDHNINKYSDFCRRILNKRSLSEKTPPLYHIIEQVEKIGDMYRDLCTYIQENKLKLNNETLNIYEQINFFLNSFYEAFYKFNLPNIEEFGQKRNEIKKLIEESLNSKQDKHILFYLNNIFNTIFDLNGALMTYHI
ncbi:MAG: AbrB/MazE/SpoVT family DNA-binding domain-containing protein [Nanoarchaeota archaeon]